MNISTRFAAPAVILQATYAGRGPVPFAKVLIFAPSAKRSEFQAGNMDKHGFFGFVPEGPGPWRVVVDDELGHRQELTVLVPVSFAAAGSPSAPTSGSVPFTQSSRVERVLLGLALMIGITGFWFGYKSRKQH